MAKFISKNWSYPSVNELIIASNVKAFHPPIIHSLFAAAISLFNLNRSNYYLLKFFSVIAGTLSVYFSYKLFEELKLKEKFRASIIVAFLPLTVIYSAIAYLDIYVLLFTTAGGYYLIKFFNNKDNKSAILFITFNAMAALSNYSGLALTLFSGFMLLHKKEIKNKKSFFVVALGGIAASPFYLRNLIVHKNPFYAGFAGAVTGQSDFNIVYSFYSFWIGAPSSGPLFERMIQSLPVFAQPFAYIWTIVMIFFTILMFIGIIKQDKRLNLLLIASIPPLLYQPQAASKLIASVPSLAYALITGINWFSKNAKLKPELIIAILIISTLHYLPLSYMLNQKWAGFEGEYNVLIQNCNSVLSAEFGRISVNTDLKVFDFGRLGVDENLIESEDYEGIISEARSLGVDCIFHDEYTLERMVKSSRKEKILGLNEYIGCKKEEINGIGYYLCRI